MSGYVSKLFDIDSVDIPEEMLEIEVDEQSVADSLKGLALRYAKESEADSVSKGDIVFCRADSADYPDSRKILLFTGTPIPGAYEASSASLEKSIGDSFETVIAEKRVILTVEKIIRRTPAKLSDELIASLGIEGVDTVDGYRNYLRERSFATLRTERVKEISGYIFDKLESESTFSYDEAEFEEDIAREAEQYKADCEQFGIEFNSDDARNAAIYRIKQLWIAKALCESKGINVDLSSAEEEADRMIEMMTLMGEAVPDREEAVKMAIEDEYIVNMFNILETEILEKMGC